MLLATAAPRAAAQSDSVSPRWRLGRMTGPLAGGQWGIGVQGGLQYSKDVQPGPSAVTGALRLFANYGLTTGSTEATFVFEAPAVFRNWRILGLARSERMQRVPFFGLANETRRSDSLQDLYGNLYYRYSLLRTGLLGAVQRRLAGPLWLHVGAQLRHYRASPLQQQPSLFTAATAGPQADTIRREGTELRGGLLFDTRDDWHATTRGVLLQALAATGRLHAPAGASGLNYRRYMFSALEFMPISRSKRTVLALRQRVALASDTLPFFLAYEQLTSWMPADGIVGGRAVRLHGGGTEMASDHAMATIEVRRKLILPSDNPLREAGLWGYVFADGALLWEPRQQARFNRNEWTIGTGFRLQFSQGSITGVDFGFADSGWNISVLQNFGF